MGQRKQTNHCKLTMVWWENDISFLFGLLQKLRVGCRSRDSVSFQSRLLAEKSFFGREQIGEIDLLGDTEDGGKGWSRGGLKEECL